MHRSLDERSSVLLVVERVPEVPAVVVEDAEVVGGEAVLHEVPVEVAVPRDLCNQVRARERSAVRVTLSDAGLKQVLRYKVIFLRDK